MAPDNLRLDQLEREVQKLKTDHAVGKTEYAHLCKAVDQIQANTSKVLWLVIAVVIKTAWDYVSSGGFANMGAAAQGGGFG